MSLLFLDVAPPGLTTLVTVSPLVAIVGIVGLALSGGLFALLRRLAVEDVRAAIASAGLLLAIVVTSSVFATIHVSDENRRAREHRNEQRLRAEERWRADQRRGAATAAPRMP